MAGKDVENNQGPRAGMAGEPLHSLLRGQARVARRQQHQFPVLDETHPLV